MARISLSAWIYLSISLLSILGAFFEHDMMKPVMSALIVGFLVLQFHHLPRTQQIAGLMLFGIGVLSAAHSGEWRAILVDGIARANIFLLLFFAISWLKLPVERSPALQAVRDYIVYQPPGRRFLFLSIGAHFLGTVLNLAGLSLLTTMVERQDDPVVKRRLSVALMQGFTCASCWSPFYIGMIVVLVALPSVSWRELAPVGGIMALAVILSGWAFDRLVVRRGSGGSLPAKVPTSGPVMLRAGFILLALVALVVGPTETLHISIPVALGIVTPPFALIWYAAQREIADEPSLSSANLIRTVIGNLPDLRNETMMFAAANMFGVGIATILPGDDMSAGLNALVPWPDAKLILIILTFLVCSAAGLHPVILVISLSAVFPPESLGLSEWIVGLTFLGCWGLSTMVSPFSGTTLFMSRVAGVPGHIIGWRWSPPSVLVGMVAVGATVIIARHLSL